MLDIETLGTSPESAALLSVGAVRFDLASGEISEDSTFYRVIDLRESLKYGRVDASTLKWWLLSANRDTFLNLIYDKSALPLATVLNEFSEWVKLYKNTTPWSKGIDFDFGILERLYRDVGIPTPFQKFSKKRDLRTLVDIAQASGVPKISIPRSDGQHNALEDAIHQAREAIAYMSAIKGLTRGDES